jgi:hypothetical protein
MGTMLSRCELSDVFLYHGGGSILFLIPPVMYGLMEEDAWRRDEKRCASLLSAKAFMTQKYYLRYNIKFCIIQFIYMFHMILKINSGHNHIPDYMVS